MWHVTWEYAVKSNKRQFKYHLRTKFDAAQGLDSSGYHDSWKYQLDDFYDDQRQQEHMQQNEEMDGKKYIAGLIHRG